MKKNTWNYIYLFRYCISIIFFTEKYKHRYCSRKYILAFSCPIICLVRTEIFSYFCCNLFPSWPEKKVAWVQLVKTTFWRVKLKKSSNYNNQFNYYKIILTNQHHSYLNYQWSYPPLYLPINFILLERHTKFLPTNYSIRSQCHTLLEISLIEEKNALVECSILM